MNHCTELPDVNQEEDTPRSVLIEVRFGWSSRRAHAEVVLLPGRARARGRIRRGAGVRVQAEVTCELCARPGAQLLAFELPGTQ
jgi:hypothetical protein